jgi:hypothetical protein
MKAMKAPFLRVMKVKKPMELTVMCTRTRLPRRRRSQLSWRHWAGILRASLPKHRSLISGGSDGACVLSGIGSAQSRCMLDSKKTAPLQGSRRCSHRHAPPHTHPLRTATHDPTPFSYCQFRKLCSRVKCAFGKLSIPLCSVVWAWPGLAWAWAGLARACLP